LNPNSATPEPQLLYTFPNALGLLGIAEMQHDIFYIISGNFSLTTGSDDPGSYALWKVKLYRHYTDAKAVVDKVTDIPEARLLNSMIPLRKEATGGIVLISDSDLGVVWKLDVDTADYSILLDLPEMKYLLNSSLFIGLNGIKL
jgi:hypothetical protein